LIERLTVLLRGAPAIIALATIVIAWLMAMITGTAVGTAPLVINMMIPLSMGNAAGSVAAGSRTGGLAAVGAQFGRTSSPVAPVVIMCASLARDRPMALVKRVAPPLIAGAIALLVAAAFWR
jgi:C4-dicarboxylate transporter